MRTANVVAFSFFVARIIFNSHYSSAPHPGSAVMKTSSFRIMVAVRMSSHMTIGGLDWVLRPSKSPFHIESSLFNLSYSSMESPSHRTLSLFDLIQSSLGVGREEGTQSLGHLSRTINSNCFSLWVPKVEHQFGPTKAWPKLLRGRSQKWVVHRSLWKAPTLSQDLEHHTHVQDCKNTPERHKRDRNSQLLTTAGLENLSRKLYT